MSISMKKIDGRLNTLPNSFYTIFVDKRSINNQAKQLLKQILQRTTVFILLTSISLTANTTAYTPDELKALAKRERATQADPLLSMGIDETKLHANARKFKAESKALLDKALAPILKQSRANPNEGAKGVMVFVSLGMPDTSLQQLLMQSQDLQVPLIVRGILPQGFTATIKHMNRLISNRGKTISSGFAINPKWLTQFGITQVPAFVAIKPGKCLPKEPCTSDDFDVIYGNVSMYDALGLLAKHGQVPDIAANALSRHATLYKE